MALANHYEAYVIPLIQSIFSSVAGEAMHLCPWKHCLCLSVKPANSLDEIVQKEAVYCAIGRCATYLENKIQFQEWIALTLIPEAKDANPKYAASLFILAYWYSPSV